MPVGIQVLGVLLAAIMLSQALQLYRKGKFQQKDFAIWCVVSAVLLVFSTMPVIFDYIANIARMGRGLDTLFIIGMLGSFALIFLLYIRVQQTNREVTELVRKVAIEIEEIKKKK